MLSVDELSAYLSVTQCDAFTTLDRWGDTTLGMVTGNNKYFALSPERTRSLGLPPGELLPLSPPGSRHLRSLVFDGKAWARLGREGQATSLFRPRGKPSAAAEAYIDLGLTEKVDEAYKCRVRTPWWRVPLVKPADLLLTYMNADAPRLCDNARSAHHLNSVHGVYLREEVRSLGKRSLSMATLSSATLLGGEAVGRSYGGGMLKLEPREADALPVPTPELLLAAAPALEKERHRLGVLTASGRLADARDVVGRG